MNYEIVVLGHIDKRRLRGLAEIELEFLPGGETKITCRKFDQASLHATINQIYNLGLTLKVVKEVALDK
ncbi:hypothetical protein [Phosphitispora fastidiosa]|uniref:hypothetical protein n=1 Tax=Phosphitispora fastidiosa TaxID=2837202 RepID=UPI001E28727E|nr:hypothetical protein [Phosphitispora fastidiosa]MBU7007582.1 hypothetical protein [Phosphitispora fastidiosa]